MPDLSFRVVAEDAVGAGIANVKRDLDEAGNSAEQAQGKFGGLSSHVGALATAAVGLGAAFEGGKFLASSVDAVENLSQSVGKMQRTIGGSAEDASRLKFALQESLGAVGANSDNATQALGRFSKGLTGLIENEDGTTTKSSALTDQLKSMGIAATDASGNALPMQNVLGQLADKFAAMPDGAQKTALAMQLFGRQGVDLIPFLNKGSEGIADLEKESDKLGLTLSQNTIQQTQKLAAAQRTFGEAMEGVKVQIGVALLPVLTMLAEQAGKFATFVASNVVPAIRDFAAWIGPQLTPYITQAQAIIAQIVPQVVAFAEQLGQKLVPVIQTVVQWLSQHQVVLAAVAVAIGTLVAGPIAAFIAAIVLVAQHWAEIQPVVQRFIEYVQTVVIPAIQHWINDVFMPRFEALKTYITVEFLPKFQAALTNIKDIVTEVVQWVVDHWQQIQAVIQPVIDIVLPALKGGFLVMKDVVETTMAAIKDVIAIILDAISGNWSGVWKDIQKLLDDVWKGIQSAVGDYLNSLKDLLSTAWDDVKATAKAAWDGLKTAIEDAVSGLLDELKKLPGQMLDAIGDLSQLLFDAGAKVIQGFIDGIHSKVDDVKGAAKYITDHLTSWKGPPEKDAQLLYGAGQLTMQGYIDGIVSKIPDVKSALGRASDEIAATAAAGFGGTAGSEDTARRATGGGNAIGGGPAGGPVVVVGLPVPVAGGGPSHSSTDGSTGSAPSGGGFSGEPVGGLPTNRPAAAPFPDHATLVNVGIQNSWVPGGSGAGRGVAGGTQSYAALAARWGLEHNPALGRMLDGTEAGARRAVEAFMAASGMGGGAAGPDWNAPIAPGSGIAGPAASGIPLSASSGGGAGARTAPTINVYVNAMDAASFQTAVPSIVRQIDLHLKQNGQVGLVK
jgi:phage-related protein